VLTFKVKVVPTVALSVGIELRTGGSTGMFTVKVPDVVCGVDSLSETMIVNEAGPVGWFDAGVQVSTPVVGLIRAPEGAPVPRLYVKANGGMFGSEANGLTLKLKGWPMVALWEGSD